MRDRQHHRIRDLGKCLVPANASTAVKGNWDHDYFVERYPTARRPA